MAIVDENHKIYADHTGKLPMKSSRGKKYILIMYVYDANVILSEPLKSRSSSHIMETYTKQVEHLKNRGYIPQVHYLDNDSSPILNKYNRQEYIGYQMVPPHIHRVNAVNKSIITLKDPFISGLVITDTWFPMHLCCCLIPQAANTLNMLRPCQQNPTMSAHTAIEGQFDFNKTPLEPPGTKVLVHKNHSSIKLGKYTHGTTQQPNMCSATSINMNNCHNIFLSSWVIWISLYHVSFDIYYGVNIVLATPISISCYLDSVSW